MHAPTGHRSQPGEWSWWRRWRRWRPRLTGFPWGWTCWGPSAHLQPHHCHQHSVPTVTSMPSALCPPQSRQCHQHSVPTVKSHHHHSALCPHSHITSPPLCTLSPQSPNPVWTQPYQCHSILCPQSPYPVWTLPYKTDYITGSGFFYNRSPNQFSQEAIGLSENQCVQSFASLKGHFWWYRHIQT